MANKESSKSAGSGPGLAERVGGSMKRAVGAVTRAARGAAGRPEAGDDELFQVLHAEHEEVAQLFEKLLATEDPQRSLELWTRVSVALLTHARAEQEIVYQRISDDEQLVEDADHGAEEHEKIESLLLEANELEPGTEAFRAKVAELDQTVRHHVDDEEGELLPKVAESFSVEAREALVAKFRERRDTLEPKIAVELTGTTPGKRPKRRKPEAQEAEAMDEEAALRAAGAPNEHEDEDAVAAPNRSARSTGAKSGAKQTSKPTVRRAAKSGSQDLDEHTVKELQDLARERGLEGRSRMRKEDLIAALSKA